MFARTGLLVTRWDYNLFDVLDEHGGHQLASVFPRAPSYWPAEWGSVPIPLPIELALYRHELIAADENSARWREVHLLFLEQIAAGWDLEYCDPTDSKSHLLPQPIAKAILDVGGFFFLPVASKSLPAFRSQHQLNDVAIPDQRAAHQAAWSGIQRARMAEGALSHLTPPRAPSSAAAPGAVAVGATGEATSTGGPTAGRRSELWPSIGASSIQAELRAALAGETNISVGSVERVVALASAALRQCNKTDTVRVALADLAQERADGSAPAGYDPALTRISTSFPILSRSLPRLFRAELGRILDALERN